MKAILNRLEGLAAGSLRLVSLILVGLCATTATAATALNTTVNSDGSFVINNTNAASFNHCTQTVSSPTLTIPASTDLPAGTMVYVDTISIGKRQSGGEGTVPNKIKIAAWGKEYTSAAKVDSDEILVSEKNSSNTARKQKYSFGNTGCVLEVGKAYSITLLNSSGAAMTGDALNVRVAQDSDSLFGSTIQWGASWRPVQELTGTKIASLGTQTLTLTEDMKLSDATFYTEAPLLTGDLTVVNNTGDFTLTIDANTALSSIKFEGSGNTTLVIGEDIWFAAPKTFTKSGTGNITVRIDAGATCEINGIQGFLANPDKFILNGGSLVNNGDNIGDGKQQITNLELTADSTVGGTKMFGLIGSGYADTTLTLNGHTLVVNITGTVNEKLFMLISTYCPDDGGTIRVDAGVLALYYKGGTTRQNVLNCTVQLNNKYYQDHDEAAYSGGTYGYCELFMGGSSQPTVKNVFATNAKGGSITGAASDRILTITGTLSLPFKATITPNITLANGATVKALTSEGAECPANGLNVDENSTIYVDVSAITLSQSTAIFRWTASTKPAGNFVFKNEDLRTTYELVKRDDGLFIKQYVSRSKKNGEYVAYGDLTSAISNADSGTEVELFEDSLETGNVEITKSATINIGEHNVAIDRLTLSGEDVVFGVTGTGSFAIDEVVVDGTVTATGFNLGSATVTVSSGSLVMVPGANYTLGTDTQLDATYSANDGTVKFIKPVASVTIGDTTTYYPTLASAVSAFGSNEGTLTLLANADTSTGISLAVGQSLVAGEFTHGTVALASGVATGYEVDEDGAGTFSLIDNTTSTWTGAGSDNSWATAANWANGHTPKSYTVVTFPSEGAPWTVDIVSGDNCAAMIVNGDTTVAYTGNSYAAFTIYGGVSGSGTLTLSNCGFNNASSATVTIATPVESIATSNCYLPGSGFVFNNTVTVLAGMLKSEFAPVTFNGKVTICNSATVQARGDTGPITFNGGIEVPANASANLSMYDGSLTIASKVTLASGASLTVPASATITDATFEASEDNEYIAEASNVYTATAKPTISVALGENVTEVTGVTDGQRVVPGDTFMVNATVAQYYHVDVSVTGATEEGGTYTVGASDITVNVTAVRNTVTVTVPEQDGATLESATSDAGAVTREGNTLTVPAGSTLTLNWTAKEGYISAGSTTVSVAEQSIEVAGSGLPETVLAVAKCGDTLVPTLQDAINYSGNDPVVTLLQNSSEVITLNKAITFSEAAGATFTGTFSGSGTLKLGAFLKNSTGVNGVSPLAASWTGTVEFTNQFGANGWSTPISRYGNANSTLKLSGGINGGWLPNVAIDTTVEIPEGKILQITAFSPSFANTLKALKGVGTFQIAVVAQSGEDTNDLLNVANWGVGYENYSAYYRIGDVSEFTGSFVMCDAVGVMIGAAKPNKNTVGGSVRISQSVTASTNWTLPNGVVIADTGAAFTVSVGVAAPAVSTSLAGYEVAYNEGTRTYTVVDNSTATWAPQGNSTAWDDPANWSTGFVPAEYTAVTIPANATISLPTTVDCVSVTFQGAVTLNLTGDLTYAGSPIVAETINFTGSGTFTCPAANTLQGTINGASTVSIAYPTGVLPTGATWTNNGWAGTLVLTNCGHLNVGGTARVPFETFGSVNSQIKAPGFRGYAAVAASEGDTPYCKATLVVEGVFEVNHGNAAIIGNTTAAGFKFKKLAGSGKLLLDGTSDIAQYMFEDVSAFEGSVEITDPNPDADVGGKKSFIFGLPANWTVDTAFPANLVIGAGTAKVAGGKTWDIPAGIVLNGDSTLELGDLSTITRLSPRSTGTISVPTGTATLTNVMGSVVTTALNIGENATLKITDTSLTTLTIPAYSTLGELDLRACANLATLYVDLGEAKTFDMTKVALPESCTTVYYDIGEKRTLGEGYSLPTITGVAKIAYYAVETADEYANGNFRVREVPNGADVWLLRLNGNELKAYVGGTQDPVADARATDRHYSQGAQFSATACWHEWDFEQKTDIADRLNDSGRFSTQGTGTIALSTTVSPITESHYSTVYVAAQDESKRCLSSAVYPYAAPGDFGVAWSTAIRCTMPSTANTVAIAFGDTENGVLGLASGAQTGVVELFNWTSSGGYVPLASLQVESATTEMHIYVLSVANGSVTLYRDGELIHTAEFALTGNITQFKVGDVIGANTTTRENTLPAVATDGYVDYVRLYDTTIGADIAAALSARRPFVSAIDLFERSPDPIADWLAGEAWAKTEGGTADKSMADAPTASANVTLTTDGTTALNLNLDAGNTKYGTLIFKGHGATGLRQAKAGTIGANMLVVRSGVNLTVDYDAVSFADTAVGVDEGASLTFDFSEYTFAQETTIQLTGVVVAHEYDNSVEGRILVTGAPESRLWKLETVWTTDHKCYAKISPNAKTFTVDAPANTTVTVTGASDNGNGAYTAGIGATVTVRYEPAGAFVGEVSEVEVEITANTSTITTDYTVVPAVAQIEGGAYYATLKDAIDAAQAQDVINVIANFTTDATKTSADDRTVVTVPVTINFGEYTMSVPGSLEPTSNWAALYVDANTTINATTGGINCLDKVDPAGECGVYAINVRNGSKLTINGGVYHGGGTIVQTQLGTVVVNGGTFTLTPFEAPYGYDFAFNCVDSAYQEGNANFDIKGGTFFGFDPQSNKAEGENTDFTAEGFIAVDDGTGTFGVVPGWVITFVDEDGAELDVQRVKAGETPVYGGATPTKTATVQYTYAFAGWSPTVEAASAARTYSATYSATVNTYTITWVVEGAETSETLEYGATPVKEDPVKPATAAWVYTFTGWTPEVATVTGNATYTAQFSQAPNDVTFSLPEVTGAAVASVSGATDNGDGTYTATIGDTVTVTWVASGAYVLSGTGVQTFKPTVDTEVAPAPSADVATLVPAVALVGTTYYATFAEALAGVPEKGTTLTLLADVALTSTVTIDKSVTLDLNGFDVTATDCRAFHVTAGTVAFTGAGTVSTVVTPGTSFSKSSSVIRVGSDSAETSFTLGQNVRVESDYCYGVTYFGREAQTVVINGTVAVTGEQAAISGNGNSWNAPVALTVNGTVTATQDYAIYNPQRGTTTINGTVTGLGGIEMKAGELAVNDGAVITATAQEQAHSTNNNGTSTTGYAIASVGNAAYPGDPVVTINGGEITGKAIVLAENNAAEAGTIVATVATISTDPDYKWVEGDTAGTYKLVAKTYVAQVGNVKYETLAGAVAQGGTVTLLADVALTSTVTIDKSVTLDLNGFDVTATDCRAFHVTAGTVAFTGAGTVSTVVTPGTSFSKSSSVIRVGSDSAETSFTLGQNVRVESDYCYGVTYFGREAQTVVINGTVAVTGEQAAISGNGNSWNAPVALTVNGTVTATQDYAIYNPQRGTTTINGTVTGLGGIEMKAGELAVNDGAVITATAQEQAHSTNNNGTSTTGYAIASVGNAAYPGDPVVTINGGEITGKAIVLAENNAAEAGTIVATVATISTDPDYKWVEGDTAGTYKLVAKTYVAEVAGQGYETLQEAINAAVEAYDGEPVTVELLVDIPTGTGLALFADTEGYPNANGVEVVVDFGGFTYTVVGPAVGSQNTQNQVLHFEAGNSVTLKNGTIKMTDNQTALAGFQIFMQNYGSLTIDNMTLDGTGIAIAKYGTFTGKWAVFSNTDKPQFNYNTAGGSVIRNSTITMPGDLGVDDNVSLLIEDDAVINVRKVVTKGTDDRYASANPTLLVQNGAKFSYDCSAILAGNQKVEADAGVYTVIEANYVAQIDTAKYETLAAAFAAVEDGDTVTLLSNIELTDRLFVNAGAEPAYAGSNNRYATTSEDKAITLDLSGYSITSESNIALAGGSLAITGIGTIATTNAGLAPIEVRGTGDLATKRTLTLGPWVTLTGSEYGLNVFGSNDAQKNVIDVEVNGTVNGTLFVLGNLSNAENEINIVINGTVLASPGVGDDVNVGIALNGNANLTVNTGAVVSGDSGIEVRAGSMTVNGGTITATAETYSYKANGSGSTTKGAAISIAQHTTVLPTAVTLNGGTLVGVEKVYVKDVNSNMSDVTVQATAGYTATATVPAGYKWADTATEGVYALVPATYVAKIGEQGYETLQAAIDAAGTTESTVKLLADVSEAVTVAAGQTITLDLDSNTINAGNGFGVINRGTLTITGNGSIIGKYAIRGQSGSRTTIENGTFTAQECVVSTAKNDTGATFVINGGTFTAVDNSVLSGNGSANSGNNTWNISGGTFNGNITSAGYVACGIYAPNNDTWTLTGGTFNITGGVGILARAGVVTVNDGVTITTTGSAIGKVGDSNVVVPCAAVVYDSRAGYPGKTDESQVSVAGGTFTSAAGVDAVQFVNAASDTNQRLAVSGGTFSSEVAEEFCAEGYIPTELEGGKYGVAKDEYVAKRGDEKFTTLAEAVSLSGSVTLLGDVTENVTIPAGKTVTLDLNGYTISGGTVSGKAAITNNGSLTIVDDSATGSGKVIREDTAPAGSYYVIDNAGTLTITGGTYTNASGDATTHTGASLIRTNKGASTTIAGGTFTQNGFNVLKDEGDCTVTITGGTLACVDAEYAILSYGKLNITGGSITGPIDIRGYKDASEDVTGTATINGGTFNSVFYVEQYTGAPSSSTPSLTITGGTFNNVEIKVGRGKRTSSFVEDATAGKVAISGGTFSAPVAAAHCAAGLEPAAVTGGYSVAVKHIENTVTVVSAREKTLVTVPQNCKVSELVKLTDGGNALRDVGDKIMAYSTTSKKFYSWMLEDTDPTEAVVLGWTPITTASEDDGEGHSTEAENFSLTKGQAVWVTRLDSTKPVFVNGEYNANGEDEASVEARKIAVDTGFNLIAPVPKKVVDENKATVDIADLVQVPEKATSTAAETTDKIVIPTTGAPVTCVVREVEPGVRKWGRWVPYVKANGRGGLRWEEGYEIPTGTGFWYVSENKKDNVSK